MIKSAKNRKGEFLYLNLQHCGRTHLAPLICGGNSSGCFSVSSLLPPRYIVDSWGLQSSPSTFTTIKNNMKREALYTTTSL